MRLARFRLALGLDIETPLPFLAGCTRIATSLDNAKALIPNPNPAVATLQQEIQDATLAQQAVGQVRGAAATRDIKFRTLLTSMEMTRMTVQALCDQSPEQAAAYAAAAGMSEAGVGRRQKPLLGLKNGPTGTVLAEANASLLDSTSRRKTFHFRCTLDGGKTFLPTLSAPIPRGSFTGLTPQTVVGVQVAITVSNQPQSAWSDTVTIAVT